MKLGTLPLLFASLGMVLSAFAPAIKAEASFRVAPSSVVLNLSPGESINSTISVQNITETSQTYEPVYYDFEPTENGTPNLLVDDEDPTPFSIEGWITAPTETFEVAAGETAEIELAVRAADDAKNQTYYGTLAFNASATDSDENDPVAAVGMLLFVNIGEPAFEGLVKNVEATDVNVGDDGTLTATINVAVENTGDYRFRPNFALDILDSSGEVVTTFTESEVGSVLPKSTRIYTAEFSEAIDSDDSYTIEPNLTFSDGTTIAGSSAVLYEPSSDEDNEATSDIVIDNEDAYSEPSGSSAQTFATIVFGTSAALFVISTITKRVMKRKGPKASEQSAEPEQPTDNQAPTEPDNDSSDE